MKTTEMERQRRYYSDAQIPLSDEYLYSDPEYDIRQGVQRATMPVFLALGRYEFFVPYYLWDDVRKQEHSPWVCVACC